MAKNPGFSVGDFQIKVMIVDLLKLFLFSLFFVQFDSFCAHPIAKLGVEGLPIFSVNPKLEVVATYLGTTAGFNNDLYLERNALGLPGVDGDKSNDLFIFNNHRSALSQKNLLAPFHMEQSWSFGYK